jgi:non-homologous end joining protein Ku
MPSAVWSGHLHFGLVVMPVRLLVAARPKKTRFRRLYRRPGNPVMPPMQLPSSKQTLEDEDFYSDGAGESGVDTHNRGSSGRETEYDYAPVRQVLQSEVTGEEISRSELVKGYEFAPNEFAAISPQEIKAAEVETSDTIDLFHFVNGADVTRFTLNVPITLRLILVPKKFMRCCLRLCDEKNASELPASGCIGESTC